MRPPLNAGENPTSDTEAEDYGWFFNEAPAERGGEPNCLRVIPRA